MSDAERIFIGKGDIPQFLNLGLANRHGLIAGATGTGKTVTLQILAEGFAEAGVPVFLADVKGDLSGLCVPGTPSPKLAERAQRIGLGDVPLRAEPTIFWDLFAAKGHPIRTTVSEMGPLLLSRLLGLNETQEGVLGIAFQIADDEGMLLLDLKDLRALIAHVGDNAAELTTRYGNVSRASVGAIQRRLLTLEQQGGEAFFGEPALDLRDLMRKDLDGRGFVSILAADKLMMSPRLYATFLLWLMAELFEELPEVGDPDKPRLVFFFDEAHLLFDDAPEALIDKIEQVVRLIRSKGVGIYFVTQNPLDVPETVLGQLGNRIQHALRAFTPRDQKAVKTAAETFRQNPTFDAAEAITQLGVGEALTSVLDTKGVPSVVERTLIRPPGSRIGPATETERATAIAMSPASGRYDSAIDRESAYETLARRANEAARAAESERRLAAEEKAQKKARRERQPREFDYGSGRSTSSRRRKSPARGRRRSGRMSTTEAIVRDVGRTLGREIVRGLLGSIFKGK